MLSIMGKSIWVKSIYSKSKIPNETKKIPPKSKKTAKRYQTKKPKGVKKE